MLECCLNRGVQEAGCDEAGRGCLAGAVYAAAVILPDDFQNDLLNDSKQLTARQKVKGDKKAFTIAKSLNVFNSVVRELKMLYVDDFDYETSVNTAIDAMLEDLDPYTVYYPADDTEELEMMITGKYAGVGAVIRYQKKRDNVVISEPYEDMPAHRAGLRAGDGCGISPDIEVKVDRVPNLLYYLANDDCLFDFATHWWLTHDSIAPAELFEVTDKMYAAFRDSVRASGFTYDRSSEKALKSLKEWAEFEGYMDGAKEEFNALEAKLQHNLDKDFDNFQKDIRLLLATEIITRYYFQRGSIIQTLKDDPDLRSARDILADPAHYRTLLQPKKK